MYKRQLMDSLFDEDGNATAENTAGKQTEVERLAAAAAADPHTLVNAERYNKAYQTYRSRETEVNSLLSAYDPAKMKASDYTTASWQTYTAVSYTHLDVYKRQSTKKGTWKILK